jgi:hypothetical protein
MVFLLNFITQTYWHAMKECVLHLLTFSRVYVVKEAFMIKCQLYDI